MILLGNLLKWWERKRLRQAWILREIERFLWKIFPKFFSPRPILKPANNAGETSRITKAFTRFARSARKLAVYFFSVILDRERMGIFYPLYGGHHLNYNEIIALQRKRAKRSSPYFGHVCKDFICFARFFFAIAKFDRFHERHGVKIKAMYICKE